ncbi:MAG: DUF1961 family protein [Phycisphaerales bacterium]|nr:MAG: DUF1961 family protein [Phycisphaerales bacterium]
MTNPVCLVISIGMRTTYISLIGSLLLPMVCCRDLSTTPAVKVLFKEDFNSYADSSDLPTGWWSEGSKAVRIEKGRLRADANLDNNGEDYGTSTIWLDKTFSRDLRVEFDAHVLASDGDKNNINFFLLFSDPSGAPLRQTKDDRADGQYGKYHKLNGYVITFLANGNPDRARFRFRDDPGFNLLQEEFTYECRQNKTYHIAITKRGNRITYAVDGTVCLDKVDDTANPEHESGIIGFRTWHTDLWWDNLKVTRL